MNTLFTLLAEDAVLRYAVNLALGASAASAIGLLIGTAVRRNAALRQGFLAAIIVVVTALPLLVLPEWRAGLIHVESRTETATGVTEENFPIYMPQGEAAVALPQNAPGEQKVSPPQRYPVEKARSAVIPTERFLWGGLLLWAVGSAWWAFLAARSLIGLRRVRARSVDAGTAWAHRAKQAAETVGLAQVPRVAFAAGAVVPFSLGGRQPVILLPESARAIQSAEAEAILVHEAGHIVHRHHLIGMVMTVAGILYWWLPLVRWTTAALADAMEEVCDNHVLRVQGDGRALGRCLVNAAEAVTNGFRAMPGSAILHGRQGLSRRLARVLEGAGNRETGMSKLGRAGSVFVALACMGVCAMVRVAPVEAEEGPEAWARYFPMTVGSEWTYRATSAGQEKPGERKLTVEGRIPLKKGGACVEIETMDAGRRGGFLYIGLRKDGYYAYHNAKPGVNEDAPPIPLALFPLKAGQSWAWQEPGRGQLVGQAATEEGVYPHTSAGGADCTATMEKMDDAVMVPAGRYSALRIRIQRKNAHSGDFEETVWYAKGVGLVRREVRPAGQKTPASVVELTRFMPGTRQAEAPEEMLPLVRKMFAGKTPPRTVRVIPLGGGRFVNHFAATRLESGSGLDDVYRTSGTKVVAFNPLSAADWNHLMEEDTSQKPLIGPGGGIALAHEIGVLMAEAMGMKTDAKTYLDQITTKGNPDGGTEVVFAVRGLQAPYATYRLFVWVEVGPQGQITGLKFGPSNDAFQGGPPASGGSPR